MESSLPPTSKRVALKTCPESNEKIREETVNSLRSFQDADADVINSQIHALDEEWDIERTIETHAASLVLVGTALGFAVSPRWFLLSGAAGAFLLKHAITGWCPPVPILRSMGVRTAEELFQAKTVLKMLRMDFACIPEDVEDMLRLVEK